MHQISKSPCVPPNGAKTLIMSSLQQTKLMPASNFKLIPQTSHKWPIELVPKPTNFKLSQKLKIMCHHAKSQTNASKLSTHIPCTISSQFQLKHTSICALKLIGTLPAIPKSLSSKSLLKLPWKHTFFHHDASKLDYA